MSKALKFNDSAKFSILQVIPLLPVFLLFAFCTNGKVMAQGDSTYFKYTKDIKLKDGIYQTFKEFKTNKPALQEFEVIKDNALGNDGAITLKYPCPDSIGSKKTCVINECFGFCKDGILYLSQGYPGYYYRMFLIGALSHYLAFNRNGMHDMFMSPEPFVYMQTSNDIAEFLLDFETGNTFLFNYKDFSDFLKVHDEELFQELQKTKNKRRMIHHFLLKYNDRHPIYFPLN